jgi:hypothetical protein
MTSARTTVTNRYFWRHYLEMVLAMGAGMAVLGSLRMLAADALGWSAWFERLEPMALAMATEMAVGMAVWMRYRRHRWTPILEMSAAMFAPFLLLFLPYWAGVLGAGGVMVAGHVLMLPAMALVMLRRPEEYTPRHVHPARSAVTAEAR